MGVVLTVTYAASPSYLFIFLLFRIRLTGCALCIDWVLPEGIPPEKPSDDLEMKRPRTTTPNSMRDLINAFRLFHKRGIVNGPFYSSIQYYFAISSQ